MDANKSQGARTPKSASAPCQRLAVGAVGAGQGGRVDLTSLPDGDCKSPAPAADVGVCVPLPTRADSRDSRATTFLVRDYDLAATLGSGQAFRWRPVGEAWVGVVAGHWVRLQQVGDELHAETVAPQPDWQWLREFLQLDVDLAAVVATFPDDEPMRASVAACRGLRLLRQDPWETLVTFICSSTKQIVQIQQIVALLCERFGERIPRGGDALVDATEFAFPTAARLAACSEAELRACKMGFRAPFVLAAAHAVASDELDLAQLHALPTAEARAALMGLHGVGRKIADCVLLFAYGKQDAFPVDVWVRRALVELYFPRRRPSAKRLERFANTHFGPNAGFAQQYLFHYVRVMKSG